MIPNLRRFFVPRQFSPLRRFFQNLQIGPLAGDFFNKLGVLDVRDTNMAIKYGSPGLLIKTLVARMA